MKRDGILILSYGGAHAQSLARRVRGGQVYCEIMSADAPMDEIRAFNPRGVILAGRAESGVEDDAPLCDPAVYEMGVPVLAVGFAARRMATQLGGGVCHVALEKQTLQTHFSQASPLFKGLSYGDRYIARLAYLELPEGFKVIAHGHGLAAAFADEEKKLYGMQFGVESNDPDGLAILSNCEDICGCARTWTTENFVEDMVSEIRERVGAGHALMAISGGVDSSVCAALMHRAIGKQMHCIYIDTGLMRKGDTRVVREMFGERMGIDVHCVNARDRFFARLEHITDPAEKWAVVSDEFSIIYREEAARFTGVDFLVKGTIYPDVLNFSDKAQNLNELEGYRLIEPARYLFKNEVRDVGEYLDLPPEITNRQPLPGSGLAMRMTGEVTQEKLTLLREADYILRTEIEQASLERRVRRYCAQLTETTSTGEDKCRYVVALRALAAAGAAEAAYRMPYDVLERVTDRILTELPLADRVVYDLTPHPPRGEEWEG